MDDRLTEVNLAQVNGAGSESTEVSTLNEMTGIFDALNEDGAYLNSLASAKGSETILKWEYITTDNLVGDYVTDDEGDRHYLVDGAADDGLIPYYLSLGWPILIGWNEFGGHWQVVIGYDDLGTDETQDDVLILADPYDTTDHNQDGYYLEPFERLVYGWNADFDERGYEVFLIPYLTDTGIPLNTPPALPEETLAELVEILSGGVTVPDLGGLAGADDCVEAIITKLSATGFTAGVDYSVADAAALEGNQTDFNSGIPGKKTLTIRLRCGTEMDLIPVTFTAETAPATLVYAAPSASVERLDGTQSNLRVTVTEVYSDGSVNTIQWSGAVSKNSAGTKRVGRYMVYVSIKGNDQIIACYFIAYN